MKTSIYSKELLPRTLNKLEMFKSVVSKILVPSTMKLLLQCLFITGTQAQLDSNGIELRDRMEEMKHIAVDNSGTNSDGFVNGATSCSKYVGSQSDATIREKQSSAQWVRFAFHDFVTANLTEGTGTVFPLCIRGRKD